MLNFIMAYDIVHALSESDGKYAMRLKIDKGECR